MGIHAEVMQSLVGRTITRVFYADGEGEGDDAWIYLDDGRVVAFTGWGHDWWGTDVEEIDVIDVSACKACGRAHPNRRVFHRTKRSAEDNRRYAYCDDGNRIAWTGPETSR